jgi:hypothetical protein
MDDPARSAASSSREAVFWHERAAQARDLAKLLSLTSDKRYMLLVAEAYDALAEEAEQRTPRKIDSANSIG